MRDLVRVTGFLVILALLLTIIAGASQVRQTESMQGSSALANDAAWAEDAILVCLALVSGAALLAGVVWMGKLRAWTR